MQDTFPILGIDHLELYCGNAHQAAYFYRSAFGFRLTGYRGPEAGHHDEASYLLEQGQVRLVLTTPLRHDHPAAEWIARHGDGVRDIALEVESAEAAWRSAVDRGARSVLDPSTIEDSHGLMRRSAIQIYGNVIHSFIERKSYDGGFLPGFVPTAHDDPVARPVGLKTVDHLVADVGRGEMNYWADFYKRVMGFDVLPGDGDDIYAGHSALLSKPAARGDQHITLPISEPAHDRKTSQIDDFLDYNLGPGVQHVALATPDIVATVGKLAAQGVEFLQVPQSYYDELIARAGTIDEPLDDLARLGILVDRDDEGYLLQIFTRPVSDRPTLCFEIIQRKGSRSFGKGSSTVPAEATER
jgi:4-hydroxyphenylpyruvate dioxygenase